MTGDDFDDVVDVVVDDVVDVVVDDDDDVVDDVDYADRGAIEQPLEMERRPRGRRTAVQTGNQKYDFYHYYDFIIIIIRMMM